MGSGYDFGWWVTRELEKGPMYLVGWVFWVIFSITLHELAHGWAAISRGDRTPIEQGRMTLNPLVHMGPMSLIVFALVGIAWGSMPINPMRLRGRHDDAAVAAAGPMMNISLAVVAGVGAGAALRYADASAGVWEQVFLFFWVGCWLNLVLAAFNMLPAPPLDGSKILASFWSSYRRIIEGEHAIPLMIAIFALVFMGALDWMFRGCAIAANWWSSQVVGLLP